MAGIDELLVAVGSAVRLVHRVPEHSVVAPVVVAVERCRHQLDEVDAEPDQVAEPLDGRRQRPLGGERPDVQLVDDPAGQLAARPR